MIASVDAFRLGSRICTPISVRNLPMYAGASALILSASKPRVQMISGVSLFASGIGSLKANFLAGVRSSSLMMWKNRTSSSPRR